ncbi:MAG: TVP38/TMEM64 family protein [Rubripirellula sp.]
MTPPDDPTEPSEQEMQQDASNAVPPSGAKRFAKPLILLAIVSLAAFLLWQFGEYVRLDYLATKEAQLRSFQADHPVLVYGVAFLVYVIVTGLSLPGAAALTLTYGWYFGFTPTLILVSFASTAGATIAFMTSRYLLRDSVQSRFGPRLQSFNEHLEEEGAFYLFTLRLIPVVPFFVINLVMGLTPIKARTFWWVSQIGMFPGTAVYVYAGSSVPNLGELAEHGAGAIFSPIQLLQLFIAFALLGLFPLIVKQVLKHFSRDPAAVPTE